MAIPRPFPSMSTPYVFRLKTRILSATAAPDLLYWISNMLESGANQLLIDMHEVLFMDSGGLGTLVIAHNRVQKAGGRLALCSLNGQARMLFDLSGMEKVFEVFPSADDFQNALNNSVV